MAAAWWEGRLRSPGTFQVISCPRSRLAYRPNQTIRNKLTLPRSLSRPSLFLSLERFSSVVPIHVSRAPSSPPSPDIIIVVVSIDANVLTSLLWEPAAGEYYDLEPSFLSEYLPPAKFSLPLTRGGLHHAVRPAAAAA